jgi:hypothetical protein
MLTTKDIQEKLASYVAKGIDLDAFEDWIVQSTWNVHQSGDFDSQHMAYVVETLLSEHSSGKISENALRKELSLLLLTPMSRAGHVLLGKSRSSNLPVPAPVWQPWQGVGTRGAVLFV